MCRMVCARGAVSNKRLVLELPLAAMGWSGGGIVGTWQSVSRYTRRRRVLVWCCSAPVTRSAETSSYVERNKSRWKFASLTTHTVYNNAFFRKFFLRCHSSSTVEDWLETLGNWRRWSRFGLVSFGLPWRKIRRLIGSEISGARPWREKLLKLCEFYK